MKQPLRIAYFRDDLEIKKAVERQVQRIFFIRFREGTLQFQEKLHSLDVSRGFSFPSTSAVVSNCLRKYSEGQVYL